MPGNLYTNSSDLAQSNLHPLNDFPSSGPLSPPSEDGSPNQSLATWAKLSRNLPKTDLNLTLNQKMSSSPYARQSPAVAAGHHHVPLELNTADPYLSAQSDPEESDFHASAIRLTPVNGSPNHTSSPYDEARRPSITSQGYLAPGGNDYPDASSSTSATNPTEGFLDPTEVMVNFSDLSNEASPLVFGTGQNAAAASNAQWLPSIPVNTTQFLDPEQAMPSPSSVPETATVQNNSNPALPTQALFVAPQQSGISSNPAYGPSRLTVSTNHVSNNDLTSPSSRGRSPIITISRTSRGDSPVENAPETRPSRSLLSPIGPDDMSNGYDDDNDDHRSISSVSVIPSHNGTYVRTPSAIRRGLDPFSRGDEYGPSPNEIQGKREQEQKNAEIGRWTETVLPANGEAGDGPATQSRGRIQPPNRIRALSTGDRPLQQADYFNLNAADRSVLGPGQMLHESSDDGIMSEDDSDGSTAPDSLPALADDHGLYDYSTAAEYTSQQVASPDESFPLYPWHDAPRDPMRREDMRQPRSSAAAMATYEMRAKEQDAASITATIDKDSIFNFSTGFERSLRITDAPKKHGSWSSSFFKRGVQQAQQRIKRQASDLSLASAHTNVQPGGPEPPQPQRKESAGSSYRHRLSLSSKHSPKPHSRSPSLTNALMSMTGQMAAVGGSHSVQAVSPHADASPKAFPAKWGRDRAKSEVPRPTTPGLLDLMTTHGGPPVASLSRYCKVEPDVVEPRVDMAPSSLEVPGADDDEDMDACDEEKGLVMEFPAISRLPVPTMEGFKSQIMQLNPRLEPALINRFAGEQVRRHRKLIEYQQKHAAAVAKGSCKSGNFCLALGGQARLLPQRKTAADVESGQTQFRVTDGHDQSYLGSEGVVAAAQFPPGVPLPPVSRLPAEFECPVCFQVKTIHKPSDWSKHIFEDIQPFTCTFPGCTEPKSFKRKADWVRHESERHRQLEWWCCSYRDCTHKCYRKNNFIQHLVREHKLSDPKAAQGKGAGVGDSSPKIVDQLVEECKHTTQDTPSQEPCRFCGNNCGTWKKLTVHLGKHMEQLAMPVLELAKQSCASQGQGHGVSAPIGTVTPFNNNTSSDAVQTRVHAQGQTQTQTQTHATSQGQAYYGDIPSFSIVSMTGGEISMEPESMMEPESLIDPLQAGDQFSGYALDPFDPSSHAQATSSATLHPQGHAHPHPHAHAHSHAHSHNPSHQDSASYPPLSIPSRSADLNLAPNSYSVSSHLPPQTMAELGTGPTPTQGSLYPAQQAGYQTYQSVAPNSPYMSGQYSSSYSSQM
ncbi:uncharacterized protein N7496_011048 [Penicillium cataractarum]|uniref:C2H2-type domain-containing protein n=1 Tax=Penicillium cataractarum TaxID=2100454 RepID=A0A9W9RFJ7_9EURO|nr:uncharacterized protein N7496_011048 [Penicillium cataractarum]KAJ5358635.1 hypothetical protein N7496_011048 [Penicillium cataractarum]